MKWCKIFMLIIITQSLILHPSFAKSEIKEDFKEAGHSMKTGFQKTGRGIKKGAKKTGRAFKEGGKSFKHEITK